MKLRTPNRPRAVAVLALCALALIAGLFLSWPIVVQGGGHDWQVSAASWGVIVGDGCVWVEWDNNIYDSGNPWPHVSLGCGE